MDAHQLREHDQRRRGSGEVCLDGIRDLVGIELVERARTEQPGRDDEKVDRAEVLLRVRGECLVVVRIEDIEVGSLDRADAESLKLLCDGEERGFVSTSEYDRSEPPRSEAQQDGASDIRRPAEDDSGLGHPGDVVHDFSARSERTRRVINAATAITAQPTGM
jgi:hypothetical protein